jgi:undecaprenyl diphosphate synthase
MPVHIAFIMDGNGRWAKKRGMPRTFGHTEGARNFRRIMRYCKDIGVKCISFYAFSTENWKRPENEVNALMNIFRTYLDDVRNYIKEEVKMVFLGDKSKLPQDIQQKMNSLEEDSKDFDKMTVLLAINYGGRDEITHATRLIAEKVRKGELNPDEITEDTISSNLYTAGYPDVDLLIRPSGEMRISNFLIWQSAYAEFYFADILWPDFSTKELDRAIIEFAHRNRRFGGV